MPVSSWTKATAACAAPGTTTACSRSRRLLRAPGRAVTASDWGKSHVFTDSLEAASTLPLYDPGSDRSRGTEGPAPVSLLRALCYLRALQVLPLVFSAP